MINRPAPGGDATISFGDDKQFAGEEAKKAEAKKTVEAITEQTKKTSLKRPAPGGDSTICFGDEKSQFEEKDKENREVF